MALSTESKRNIALIIIVLILAAVWFVLPKHPIPNNTTKPSNPSNLSYKIEGTTVALTDGQAQNDNVITKIFSQNTQGDLNGDGIADTAVILTQTAGGNGTFYYVAAAIKSDAGYTGTNAVFIGDRARIQTTEIRNGLLIVNYVDKDSPDYFLNQISVGKSLYLEYFKGTLIARPEAIQLTAPYPYQEITSPLTITGQARGTWFFEASFPVILTDWDGQIIAQGTAMSQGDWMTENFVPFTATLTFTKPPYENSGTLILKKDNPSGLPQNDAALEIPIVFK